jgi:acetolactate synthase-1/2/3 large subunit
MKISLRGGLEESRDMNVTEAVAQILVEEGTDYLFGFPSNPLLDSGAAEEAGIRTIVVRQERTGAHMADAVSRITSGNEVGVFCCQHGPGTENSFGGVAQAYAESVPMVAFPRGYDRAKTDVDPKFNSRLNYEHVTKTAEQLNDPDALVETVRRAFHATRNGRPRPALVEIPMEVWDMEVGEFDDLGYTATSGSRVGPDPAQVDAALDAVLEADDPVLFAGQGVNYAEAWEPLKEFAELLELPVATSLNAKGAFPEDHDLSLGAAAKSEPRQLAHFLQETDCLFGVGCSFSTTAYGITVPTDNTIVHSTLDTGDIDKEADVDVALPGDAKLVLEALVDAAEERLDGPRGRREDVAAEIATVREAWLDDWSDRLASDEAPISPYRVVAELDDLLPKAESIVTADAGNPRDFMAPFYTATEPMSYVGWGKTTHLGYSLGLMLGAKIAEPEKLCVNVWGDGAVGMTGTDIETATREDLPVLSIYLKNYEMASYDTPFGGDYAALTEALGGKGIHVEDPGELRGALQEGIETVQDGTYTLVQVVTEKETELSRPDLNYEA